MGAPEAAYKNILLIDDDPILCMVVREFLSNGIAKNIYTAHNGREALEIIDLYCSDIDFILCDLNMPEMDGVQFLRHVAEKNYTGLIAIISGEADSTVSLAKKLAGRHNLQIVATFPKPLNFNDLKTVILKAENVEAKQNQDEQKEFTESDLRSALANRQIVAFYQPKLEVSTGRLIGAEALARWDNPELGLIGPDKFIPLAEETGLITDLTAQIIDAAVKDSQYWKNQGIDFKTAINLSVAVLNNLDLPDEIAKIVADCDLERSLFTFEITESKLLAQAAEPMEVMARLSLMGFDLSIDDFGTGHSNIESIRDFPFTELKIDRSFVTNAADDEVSVASVDACVELAKKLGMRIVAEGVETMQDWDFIASKNIDQAQGYFLAKPMPIWKLKKWVFAHRKYSANLIQAVKPKKAALS